MVLGNGIGQTLEIVIDGDPIPWKRPGQTVKGPLRRYDTQARLKEVTRYIISSQLPNQFVPYSTALHVELLFHIALPDFSLGKQRKKHHKAEQPHYQKPDIDNFIKFYLDCMTGFVYSDDCKICHLVASKAWVERPQTIIRIKEIS